jgi:hypothetical protein
MPKKKKKKKKKGKQGFVSFDGLENQSFLVLLFFLLSA